MSNENQNTDIDSMSDEEISNLSPDDIQKLMSEEKEEVIEESLDNKEEVEVKEETNTLEIDENQSDDELENNDIENVEDDKDIEEIEKSEIEKEVPEKVTEDDSKDIEVNKTDNLALDFYKKITAPFKADNKEITIKSPEDAIRLMQMGTNYSRRMAELKPLRAMDTMLKEHGLDDPTKLSFLIDVSNGKKEAIKKLLKDNDIDPLDFDTSEESKYEASNYTPDTKITDFKEAVQETLDKKGGVALITDINKSWDNISKEELKNNPQIFNILLDQQNNGLYKQITDELAYEQTLGNLTNVPFLQAYHQVGQAMENAGKFKDSKSENLSNSNNVEKQPIDTGPRKAPKKPNPNPSSISQPNSRNNTITEEVKDFALMSDEDILKMSPPE